MHVLGIATIVLSAVVAAWGIYLCIRNGSRLGVEAGLIFGSLHFLVLPLLLLVAFDELELPPELAFTSLPNPISLGSFSEEIVIAALLVLVTLVVASLRVMKGRSATLFKEEATNSTGMLKRLFWMSAVFHFMSLVALFFLSDLSDGGHWYRSRLEFMERAGALGPFLPYFIFSVRILALASIAALFLQGRDAVSGKLTILLCIAVLDLYVTGNRIFFFQIVTIFVAVLMISRQWGKIFVIGLLAVPFGLAMNLFRYVRAILHEDAFSVSLAEGYEFAISYSVDNGIRDFIYGVTEAINLHTLVAIVKEFPLTFDTLGGGTYLRGLLFPIPRIIWPDKPEGVSVVLGELFANGQTSLAATIVGEAYVNVGPLAIVFIPVVIFCLGILCRRLFPIGSLGAVLGFILGVSAIRMSFADVFITLVFLAVLVRGERFVFSRGWRMLLLELPRHKVRAPLSGG